METEYDREMRKKMKRLVIGVCAGLLILFGALSYSAALTKSATFDEPLHLLGGYVHRTRGDFRINPEDPALFGYWASIPHIKKDAMPINTNLKSWDTMAQDFSTQQWIFVAATFGRWFTGDFDALLQKSRFMFVIVGVMLGALIAWWGWQLGGAAAAIFATAMFALDPNFLAHSALVKNDVMLSLLMLAMAISLWKFGQRGTWLWLAGLTLSCAAAVNVKFSGVLFGPIIFVALTLRALLPQPWVVMGKTLETPWRRLLVVPAVCLIVGVFSYVAIWACYGFRFAPTDDPKVLLNTPWMVDRGKSNLARLATTSDQTPSIEQIRNQPPGMLIDTIVWAEKHHLLPQSWLHGFLYTYVTTLLRSSFLMGESSIRGWWYYFPMTMLFKTPTATLAAIGLSIVAAIMLIVRKPNYNWWTITCVGLPPLVYMCSAMTTNLNLGLRHILPVYPFIFLTLGWLVSVLSHRWKLPSLIVAGLILYALASESLKARPNYIAFFNAPSRHWREPIDLLGDSNLDWGQDLKPLAEWQKKHPKKLYLSFFGVIDPVTYGIHADIMPSYYAFFTDQLVAPKEGEDCYVAIAATNLQGIYLPSSQRAYIQQFRSLKPIEVLGGTMYIYELPIRPEQSRQSAAP